MSNFQKIKIDENEYFIIDSIQNLRAEDSFIFRKNKLSMFKGNGESRKYVGSYIGSNGNRLSDFFEYSKWGEGKENGKRIYTTIQDRCFFSKTNLLKYLYDARVEYQKQEQIYNFDISEYYNQHIETVNGIEKEKIFFSIYDVSDFKDNKLNRGYIRSDDKIWDIWRRLVLPKISYLSILKLIPVSNQGSNSTPLYYFRILLDYQFRSIVHPKISSSTSEIITKETKKRVTKKTPSREGQHKYRKSVIEHMPQCPFTKISDERLLIASHIKPYITCINEDKVNEAIDYLNGLALSPTYDKLFDQGYITFTDKGELICGTQLTAYTWERLRINPNAKNVLRIYPEQREKYLEYHRQNVFQDNIDDLI
ncbi:HNH endonuclease [Bernardetia sp. OM2101]|uniref:HNH endonuclease n=1 Tax=Bernardetia sp. OM2101 TaxID=3344876 RepID=UPI0035CF30E7